MWALLAQDDNEKETWAKGKDGDWEVAANTELVRYNFATGIWMNEKGEKYKYGKLVE